MSRDYSKPSRQRRWQLARIAQGLCRQGCGRPLGRAKEFCDECRERNLEATKARQQERAQDLQHTL